MGGEDFAYFAEVIPAAFFRVGSGSAGFNHPGHHPQFDFDETAIGYGVKTMVQAVLDYFNRQ
jgi:amidohydrolase